MISGGTGTIHFFKTMVSYGKPALSKLQIFFLLLTLSLLALAPNAARAATDNWTDDGNYDVSWYMASPDAASFEITTAKQLAGVAYLVNNGVASFVRYNSSGYAIQQIINIKAPIDLSSHLWVPIGGDGTVITVEGRQHKGFCGVFDGGSYPITGMRVDTDQKFAGFFGESSIGGGPKPTFCSINLAGDVKGAERVDTYAAGIVAYASSGNGSGIYDCVFSGTVSGYWAAGITCANNSGVIMRCVNKGTVSGSVYAGGISGCWYGGGSGINSCSNVGDVGNKELGKGGAIVGDATAWGDKFDLSDSYWLTGSAPKGVGKADSNTTEHKYPHETASLAEMPAATLIVDYRGVPLGFKPFNMLEPTRWYEGGVFSFGPCEIYPAGSKYAASIKISCGEYVKTSQENQQILEEEYRKAVKISVIKASNIGTVSYMTVSAADGNPLDLYRSGSNGNRPKLLVTSVVSLPEEVRLDKTSLSLTAGDEEALIASVLPAGAPQGIIWRVDKSGVVTVKDGTVTAIAAGTAVVTAAAATDPAKSSACAVTVKELSQPRPEKPVVDPSVTVPDNIDVTKTPEEFSDTAKAAAAISSDIKADDLEVMEGAVFIKGAKADEIITASLAQQTLQKTQPLPVFNVGTDKAVAAASWRVKGAALLADTVESVDVRKIVSAAEVLKFTYTADPASFADGCFTILDAAGKTASGAVDAASNYQVLLFIADNGIYDMNKNAGTVTDPAVIVKTAAAPVPPAPAVRPAAASRAAARSRCWRPFRL